MGAAAWIERRPWTSVALALLAVFAIIWGRVMFEKPRLDRDWVEHLAQMPAVELHPDRFALSPATDWSYDARGPVDKHYTSFAANFADLRNVWFVVEPHPGMKPMAHTLVLFEFADNRMIGLTIEARREANEDYDAFLGAFNKFELAYIWSTPKDLLTRRAVFLDHDVLVYPLRLDETQKHAFLRSLLEKTIAVSTKPRFYNTLVSNCTNELAKTAGLNWHYAFILTGYSAERLYDLKMIPGETISVARERAMMKADLAGWNALPTAEFDAALLDELRRRNVPAAGVAQTSP